MADTEEQQKEEQVELATVTDDQLNINPANDDDGNEVEIKEKIPESKGPNQKTIIIIVVALLILVGIIILIVVLATGAKDAGGSDEKPGNEDVIIDIEEWSYNILLSKEIDATGLEHGILYKQLNLTQTPDGINRINFDGNYSYNGPMSYTQTWLNAQSRTVYNFALAYENTNELAFLNYAENGIQGIFNDFYDEIYGGYFRSIIKYNNGTRIIDNDEKDSYQHNFLIKALSKLYQVTLNETYINEADKLYKMLWDKFTDDTGVGLEQKLTRNFENATEEWKSTDPMLHFYHCSMKLYEAYLTYYDNDGNDTDNAPMLGWMKKKINTLYDFLMQVRGIVTKPDTNQNHSVIFVYYDNNWEPEPLGWPLIDNVNIGHGMEFAVFTWQFMDLGVIDSDNKENVLNANELFVYSIALAYNETDGALDYLHGADAPEWQWWQQSQWWIGIESIRTISYFNTNYDDTQIDEFYTKEFIQTFLNKVVKWYDDVYYDKKYGGIYPVPQEGVYDKGYEWKVGYHTIESLLDLLNIINSNQLNKL